MKVLVTGRGTSGSWAIRGEQLGAAIGATVERQAAKVKGYDLAIIVKRCPPDLLHRIRQAGVPIVYDIVDSWPQPQPGGNTWERAECMGWLRGQVSSLRPIAIVAATQAMAEDCAECGRPVLALPHHARPGQRENPIRERVQKVGYEGGEQYLGCWRGFLEAQCAERRWEFVVNPPALADLDIVVAMRDSRGYAAQHWKSNVKLANAQGSGTPCIVNRESGYMETLSGGEQIAETPKELADALAVLQTQTARRAAAVVLKSRTLHLEDLAGRYKVWLRELLVSKSNV